MFVPRKVQQTTQPSALTWPAVRLKGGEAVVHYVVDCFPGARLQ